MRHLIKLICFSLCLVFLSCGDDDKDLVPEYMGSVPAQNSVNVSATETTIITIKYSENVVLMTPHEIILSHFVTINGELKRVEEPVVGVVSKGRTIEVRVDLEEGFDYTLIIPGNKVKAEKSDLYASPFNLNFSTKIEN